MSEDVISQPTEEATEKIEASEPASEAARAEQEGSQPDQEGQQTEAEQKPAKQKSKTARDFGRLLKINAELREQARQLKAALEAHGKPTLEQYDHDIEKYTESYGEHIAQSLTSDAVSQQAEAADAESRRAVFDAWEEIKAGAAQQYPDLEAVFDQATCTRSMAEALVQLDNAADVAYYLGKHPEESRRIAALPDHLQTFELARLAGSARAMPKQTKAPAPLSEVARGTGRVDNDMDSIPIEEYMARYNKAMREGRR